MALNDVTTGVPSARASRSAEAAVAAAEAAGRLGIPISFDGNYRAQLWEAWDSDPKSILTRLVAKAQILFGNHRDISLLLGARFGGEGPDRRREAAEAAFGAFPNLNMIASTARHVDEADRHRIAARIDTPEGAAQTEEVVVAGLVDRIGAGDAFAAGVLHGIRSGRDLDWTVRSGLALTCLKHSLPGDFSLFGTRDIEAFMAGGLDVRLATLDPSKGAGGLHEYFVKLSHEITGGQSNPSLRAPVVLRTLSSTRPTRADTVSLSVR